jgi:hypothetical protein
MLTIVAKIVPYAGSARCKVGSIYGGKKCGKKAEAVTIYEASNGWRYRTNPRCAADTVELFWDDDTVEEF